MSFFFSKLLPIFVYPIGLTILLGVLAIAAGRFRRVARAALIGSVVVLWISSMPAFANWLSRSWEIAYPIEGLRSLPPADAIVLLGGILSQESSVERPRLTGAVDRIFAAAELFRAGKAPRVLISGGNVPWESANVPEAFAIKPLLVELGVPAEAIFLEAKSRNTRENAVNSAMFFRENGWTTALLVTSADHMRRAIDCFRVAGVRTLAAPADVRGRLPAYNSVLDVFPDASALQQTTSVVKEVIGLIYYRLRGWA